MKVANSYLTGIKIIKITVEYNGYLHKLLALNLLCRFYAKLPESADHIDQRQEGQEHRQNLESVHQFNAVI